MRKNYHLGALALYSCMFLHGIQAILLAYNSEYLAARWGVTVAEVFTVIAWTGIGKILFQAFSGSLSDVVGRRPMVVVGTLGYVALFYGIGQTESLAVAKALSFIGGAATSLYDGGVNPGIMEIFPQSKSAASIGNKGAISLSGIGYPLLLGLGASGLVSYSLLFWIPLGLSLVVLLLTLLAPLPDDDIRRAEKVSPKRAIEILEERQGKLVAQEGRDSGNWAVEGILFPLLGLCIYSTFYLFQQVVTLYALEILNLGPQGAGRIASLYQLGSLASVLLSMVILGRGVRDIGLMTVYMALSALAAFFAYAVKSPVVLGISAAAIGFCAAGGVLQMGNALFNQFFTRRKGRNTNVYYFVMSLGSFLMPKLASLLQEGDFTRVLLADGLVALLGFGILLVLGFRYRRVFGVSPFART
ncbi:MAG: MFS transporter [Tissierellia bacterium]|nr:MFS transporter [Tissierellia bacterium]